MSFETAIGGITTQMGKVNTMQDGLGKIDATENPEELLDQSMQLMKETQKLEIMTESFTKYQKALHDANKSAIQNMH